MEFCFHNFLHEREWIIFLVFGFTWTKRSFNDNDIDVLDDFCSFCATAPKVISEKIMFLKVFWKTKITLNLSGFRKTDGSCFRLKSRMGIFLILTETVFVMSVDSRSVCLLVWPDSSWWVSRKQQEWVFRKAGIICFSFQRKTGNYVIFGNPFVFISSEFSVFSFQSNDMVYKNTLKPDVFFPRRSKNLCDVLGLWLFVFAQECLRYLKGSLVLDYGLYRVRSYQIIFLELFLTKWSDLFDGQIGQKEWRSR